jgi:large subunit ribosomal protein L35
VRAGGSIKRSSAYMRHILTKKSTKRKRHLRGTTAVDQTNKRQILAMLPYAK